MDLILDGIPMKKAVHYGIATGALTLFVKEDVKQNQGVLAVCAEKDCPWRIYASINSSSPRVVVRSLQEEQNCTWCGKVTLLTNARIAELYIEEFRESPNISLVQLQNKLLKRNINVAWMICERTRLRWLLTFDREQAP
ncbi:unnamed protein product, partial [Thlaspi arvense]